METNDLHKWLRSGKNYQEGLLILKRIDPDFSKMYLLEGSVNSVTWSILNNRLQELSHNIPEKFPNRPEPKIRQTKVVVTDSQRDYSKLSPELQIKYARSGAILSEANFIKGQILLRPQNQRPELIAKVMDLYNERRIIWNQIDDFFSGNTKPEPEETQKPKKRGMAPESDDINLQIKRLRQNISKHRNRADRKNDIIEWTRKLEYLKWEKNARKAGGKK